MEWDPSNINAEESLIGAMIKYPDDYSRIFEQVKPDDFYNKRLGEYYKSALRLHKDGANPDFVMLSGEINDDDFTHLGGLIASVSSNANIYGYAGIVKNKSVERDALTKLSEAMEIIKGEGKTQDKAAEALSLVSSIDTNDSEAGPIHVKDIATEWLNVYEDRINNDSIKGLKTGVDGLDKLYGHRAVGETDMVVIGGRSKMGKTAFATMIASEVAYAGKHTLVFSMEMPRFQILERFLTQDAQVSGDNFYQPMDDYDYAKVSATVGKMIDSHLYIDDRPNLSLNQIKSTCRRHQEEHGELGAIFVDYFTLMKIQAAARHDLAHGANSTGLKEMAKELKVPVFLLAQLSRGVDSRPNKRPLISDLRESGSLEQDADSIIFLYKDSVYNPDNGLGGMTEVMLAANRHGEAGTAYVDMKAGYFVNMDEAQVNERQFSADSGQSYSGDDQQQKTW